MTRRLLPLLAATSAIAIVAWRLGVIVRRAPLIGSDGVAHRVATVRHAVHHDRSARLDAQAADRGDDSSDESPVDPDQRATLSPPQAQPAAPPPPPIMTAPAGSRAIEQTRMGDRPAAKLIASFDGLGQDFN